jgi:hypothetical protein
MIGTNRLLITSAVLALSIGTAYAGPCNTASRDAGSGNVPGYTGHTTGMARSDAKEHPPTAAMNKKTDGTAASSQDAQRQMQGKPTAAEQAEGKTADKTAAKSDQGC